MRMCLSSWVVVAAGLVVVGCGGSGETGETGGAGGGTGGGGASTGSGAAGGGVSGLYAKCGAAIVGADGEIDPVEYEKQARATDVATIDCRLGPSFDELHPGAEDTREEVYSPPDLACGGAGYLTKDVAVQAGVCPQGNGGCYGSVSGQVVLASDAGGASGADDVQLNAWESGAITFSPKLLGSPDGFLSRPSFLAAAAEAGVAVERPIAAVRQAMSWTNDSVVVYPSGAIATAGTATSGSRGALYAFAPHLVPTAAAWTTGNEFVLVTLWNTESLRGELAFFSVRAPGPNAHSFWYHGLINAGGVRELKLLGTIELPFATPTSVATATNASRLSPHDSQQKLLSQLSFTHEHCFGPDDALEDPGTQTHIGDWAPGGGFNNLVASHGYAVVASRWEGKVAFVDLAPLLGHFSEQYFGSKESCEETLSQFVYETEHPEDIVPQSPADVWPYPFTSAPEQAPVVTAVFDVPEPRAVLAGLKKSAAYGDPDPAWKAYVASEDGTLHVFSPGALMAGKDQLASGQAPTGEPEEIGTAKICASPTALLFNRYGGPAEEMAAPPVGKGVLPPTKNGGVREPDSFNNSLHVVCRGERAIQSVAAFDGDAAVYATFQEKRMNDPVDLAQSDRAAVWSVLDFEGKSMLTYRVGAVKIEDWKDNGQCGSGASFGPGPTGMDAVDFGGSLTFSGHPLQATFTNVN